MVNKSCISSNRVVELIMMLRDHKKTMSYYICLYTMIEHEELYFEHT